MRNSASSTAVLPPPITATALAAEEEAVARGAGGHTGPGKRLFGRQAEPARLRTGRQHHRVGRVDVAAVALRTERASREVERGDHVVHQLRADVAGLRHHLVHQPRTLHGLGEAGVVLDLGRDGQLPARLQTLHQQGREAGARGVDRGGVAGRPAAQDQDAAMDGA